MGGRSIVNGFGASPGIQVALVILGLVVLQGRLLADGLEASATGHLLSAIGVRLPVVLAVLLGIRHDRVLQVSGCLLLTDRDRRGLWGCECWRRFSWRR